MTVFVRVATAAAAAYVCIASSGAAAAAFAVPLSSSTAQVWVAGRRIPFDHLGIAYGDPVVPVDDAGLRGLFGAVAATSSWQPGTRFVAISRADGKLVTFTLGSNAVSVDGAPVQMPFAPFTIGARVYLPLLPLARALNLGVRGFRGGYVFVPQILAVTPRLEPHRTVVAISASAPLAWRSTYSARERQRTLTLSFPGFGTDAAAIREIHGALATSAIVTQTGPPGYPTTSVVLAVDPGVKFLAHRVGAGVTVEVVLARSDSALRQRAAATTPVAVRIDTATPIPIPTSTPNAPTPAVSASPSSPSPDVEPTEVPTAQPLGPEPGASVSPAPSVLIQDQKITDVVVVQTATGTRITLTLTGPVTFEWHRLADPDNRYWLDIDHALLVGPAQTLGSKLAFIKEMKISQHLLVPNRVVRLSIAPTQAIDVRVGSIEGSPNQLGIEIENQTPAPDAPTAGIGSLLNAIAGGPTPFTTEIGPTDPSLIVIDPGHGGSDPGSLNQSFGLTESKLTLAIARRLADNLRRQGWKVTLTRDGDYDVGDPKGPDKEELQARCDVANAAGARLFVSVHINASVSSSPNGVTTYFWRPEDKMFAQAVQTETVAAVGITDDGVKRDNFYVIHHTVMPAILVETAYLSNPHDADLLRRPAFLDKLAAGIARGISVFTGGPQTPLGQARPSRDASSQGT